jgi:DNA repair protein RadA/Sms
MKTKTTFFCQNCGSQYPKWMGQCKSCGEWNALVEEVITKEERRSWKSEYQGPKRSNKPQRISEIELDAETRMSSTDSELDHVLGGGIVGGSLVLIGGEPGIGKSTLMLQVALSMPQKILYVSGEESPSQLKMRAERLNREDSDCLLLAETQTQNIFRHIAEQKPEVVIIDSIQTLHTDAIDASPGSISQIRETTGELLKFAKETGTPVFIIGHITKDGQIAGPKILEHMVDVVLQFEGDRHHVYSILRSQKNRFGATSEMGIYEMQQTGLRVVTNPSELLVSGKDQNLSGTAIAATLEGMRPLMIEVQALVSTAVYGTPQRTTTGYHIKRLHMLLAVLEKRSGFKLAAKDVFLNLAGGIQVDDPAVDLAVIASILSSNENEAISQNTCFAAEVGLAGEIRPVNRIEQRIAEAEKLGFEEIIISKFKSNLSCLVKLALAMILLLSI